MRRERGELSWGGGRREKGKRKKYIRYEGKRGEAR